jgi:hypothetical protein
MKTIIRDRETGKARQLIEYAAENNAVVAAENPDAFRVKAASYGYPDIKVIDWVKILMGDTPQKFVIHNADKFLKYAFGNNCIGFSATLEE